MGYYDGKAVTLLEQRLADTCGRDDCDNRGIFFSSDHGLLCGTHASDAKAGAIR